MKITYLSGITMTENFWRSMIIALSALVIALTVWCLSHGITTIFMHLYYLPIVLLAYHYRKKGFVLALLLSLTYLSLVIAFVPVYSSILEAGARTAVFIGVAALVYYLSENLVRAEDALRTVSQIQLSIIQNANVWLVVI
ncbi:MAG: hypothetical protein WCB35_00100, partial [Methanoregula sp.]